MNSWRDYDPDKINKPGELKMNYRFLETIDGKEVERPPRDYPYSYSRVCIYKNGFNAKTDRVAWSDRILSNYENAWDLWNEILGIGQFLSAKAPDLVEEWLRAVLGNQNIILTGVEEECNVSTGYPYWILYYREEPIVA